MPTQYQYGLVAPGGVTTNAKIPPRYAFTRRIDPLTRDYVMHASTWAAGDPAVELVLLTIATPKRSYKPDPTLGPDYRVLDKATKDVSAKWKVEIENALSRFVPSRITDLVVLVDPPIKGRINYSVTFTDPRITNSRPTTLPLFAGT